MDLATILSTFQEDHPSGDIVSTICIRRKKLLDSAIKAISRVTFCWTDSPQIEFVGEDADDMGGPQREFFRFVYLKYFLNIFIKMCACSQVITLLYRVFDLSLLLLNSRLLMMEVQTSLGIFEGKTGQVFLSYDQAALDQNKYYKAGNLIAWSIAHGGPCIKAQPLPADVWPGATTRAF